MNFKRMWVIFQARNREFFRDRSAFGWNLLFPFLIVVGFGIIFGGKDGSEFKVGIFPWNPAAVSIGQVDIPPAFKQTRYIKFIGFAALNEGLEKLRHHKIDFLIKAGDCPWQYWINDTSPNGYIAEKMFTAALAPDAIAAMAEKKQIQGAAIRYIDWLFPGILAMNMMFSALWGVGYVVVRYRKTGVLKRLKATPLTALEYLTAQMLSRIFVLMVTLIIVWIGCDAIFSFHVEGSYLNLLILFFLGGLSLTSVGLLLASRGTSEEFTSGILNFITWPMMFLSEVWFSMEGAPEWIKAFSQAFPLTHMLRAIRKIMNDGAGLMDVGVEMSALLVITAICLAAGAALFSWNK
ncbi:MAG: ABC transporter permease [Desulfobacterales bacterium]|nr:ABC transporter permease [Desulfobacterales bacterium]MDD4072755.1 ABC transporter permease [Desulfobacterales bacterium]MDD4392471.1 ABC transporter permease [Desulfobacterales bacterium]